MSNSIKHLRTFRLLGAALLLTAGATTFAAPPKEPAKAPPYNLAVDVDAPGAVRAQLDVRIPNVKEPLSYQLTAAKDGGITGGVYIPPGKENLVSVKAFDARGEQIYTGSGLATVDAKLTREVTIKLSGKDAGHPLEAKLGTYRFDVGFGANAGDGWLLQGTLVDAYNKHIPFKPDDIKWQLPPGFEVLPYSCFLDALCIELPKPDPLKEIILACYKDITCWNKPPKDTRGAYLQVAVGVNHTCALTTTNDIRCWGDNQNGQLGATGVWCPQAIGLECSMVPIPVVCPAGSPCKFRTLAAAGNHTCAIDTAGKAWCWGEDGLLATGAPSSETADGRSPVHRLIPAFTPTGGAVDFVAIDTAMSHTCALSAANDVFCWGDNSSDQLGFPHAGGRATARATMVLSGNKYKSISTGLNHTCALQTNALLDCWGSNFDFQLAQSLPGAGLNGFNMFATLNTKVPLLHGRGVSRVAAGPHGTCAENDTSDTVCWGSASFFVPPNSATPGFLALHYSYSRTMALEMDKCGTRDCTRICLTGIGPDLFCGRWDLGIPPQLTEVADPPSDHYVIWTQVDVGANHVCAVTTQRDIWCFGINKFGQFGTNAVSTVRVDQPTLPAIR